MSLPLSIFSTSCRCRRLPSEPTIVRSLFRSFENGEFATQARSAEVGIFRQV